MRTFAFLTVSIAILVLTINAGVIKRTDAVNLAYVTGSNKPLRDISDLTGVIIEGRLLAGIKRGLPIAGTLLSPPKKSAITESAATLKSDTKKTEKAAVAGEQKEEKEEENDKEEEDEEKKESALLVVGSLPFGGLPINEDLLLGEP